MLEALPTGGPPDAANLCIFEPPGHPYTLGSLRARATAQAYNDRLISCGSLKAVVKLVPDDLEVEPRAQGGIGAGVRAPTGIR